MHRMRIGAWVVLVCLFYSTTVFAQQPDAVGKVPGNATAANSTNGAVRNPVPRLIKFSGVLKDATGQPLKGERKEAAPSRGVIKDGKGNPLTSREPVRVTFSFYQEQEGGEALWQETQNVELDAKGNYVVLLGATREEGVPLEPFLTGQAVWLGIQAEGETEEPRVLLTSVPYALKAGEADTLGGLPASAFVQTAPQSGGAANSGGAPRPAGAPDTGTQRHPRPLQTDNVLAKFVGGVPADSAVMEVGGTVTLTDPAGALTFPDATTQTTAWRGAVLSDGVTLLGDGTATPLGIADGGVGTTQVADNAITAPKIAAGAVTASHIAAGSVVTSLNAMTDALTVAAGANITVTPGPGTLTIAAPDALTAVSHDVSLVGSGTGGVPLGIAPGGVTTTLLADAAVTGTKIAAGQVVRSLNSITDNATLAAGSNITITPLGSTLTIAAPDALASVVHNATLAGLGTGGSPLSVAAPLVLSGSVLANGIVQSTNTNADGFGVVGVGTRAGVDGESTAGAGVVGFSTSSSGVQGQSGTGSGVRGVSTSGNGVSGEISVGTSTAGVLGISTASSGNGVIGEANTGSAAYGVWGRSTNGVGGYFTTDSATQWAVQALGTSPTGQGIFVRGRLAVQGRKSGAVETESGKAVLLYALETPEPVFEDLGSGMLEDGVAVVAIEPTFAKTVNTNAADYLVFLTPEGPNPNLYVTGKTAASFEVRAVSGPDIRFNWRVVAKQKGNENIRLETIDLPRHEAEKAAPSPISELSKEKVGQP